MADASKMIPYLVKWEGKYSNHPNDAGGCTMIGVTIGTYRKYYGKNKTCEDLKHIKQEEWLRIFKQGYWDKMKADQIENQSLAELCVDWLWGSGPITAIKKIQSIIGAKVDGVVGPETLGILNSDPERWFGQIWVARRQFFYNIVERKPSQQVFLKGWLRRLNDITWKPE